MNKQINKREKNTILNQKNKKGFNNKEINKENKTNEEENINMYNNLKLNPIYDIPELYNIDTKYRSKLNERMDLLMKKIDQKIINNNYNQLNMIIQNPKINYINNNNNIIPENIEKEDKEDDDDNDYIEKISEEKNEKEIKTEKNLTKNEITNNNKNNEIIINKLLKRNKFLENELNYYKYKLDKIEKQKNFIQDIIKNDTYIKRHLFDIFTVDYFKNIALNWKEVSNLLIDELIIDEIQNLTEVKLKLRKIERIKGEYEQKENESKEISQIDIEEFNLFNQNLKGIKQAIKSVKESERNLCKKYKVNLNG